MTRRIVDYDEQDAYTGFRKYVAYLTRPGAVKRIKRKTHKRERREGVQEVRKLFKDYNDEQ